LLAEQVPAPQLAWAFAAFLVAAAAAFGFAGVVAATAGVITAGVVTVAATAGVVTAGVKDGAATVAAAPAAALVDGIVGVATLTVAGAGTVTSTDCTGAAAGRSAPAQPAKIAVVPSAVRVAVM
jgi:hypothetical protein